MPNVLVKLRQTQRIRMKTTIKQTIYNLNRAIKSKDNDLIKERFGFCNGYFHGLAKFNLITKSTHFRLSRIVINMTSYRD